MELWNKVKAALFAPVSIMNLVVFRVAFGAIMLWEVFRYFENGWIRDYWIEPEFNFTYEWFQWVTPWEGEGMILHFYLLGLLSVLIMAGLFYRVATVLMFFAFTYTFLLEQARYLNHFHLVSLISFLMIFVPAHRNYSVDSILWKNIKSDFVPAWTVFLLAFQIGVAYFFGAVAKMNYDWLILAQPMQHWLADQTNYPIIVKFFDKPWMAYFMSWSGMFLDLLAPFLLLNRKTRPFMFAAILSFHFMNDRLFQIGIFPWFMILASTIFFKPDWFLRFLAAIKNNYNSQGALIILAGIVFSFVGLFFHSKPDPKDITTLRINFELLPFLTGGLGGAVLVWLCIDAFFTPVAAPVKSSKKQLQPPPVFAYNKIVVALIVLWAIPQIVLPLRHYFIPGEVSWTEEGHRFSWHMKLRDKSGTLKFFAYDPATGHREQINVKKFIKRWQFNKMVDRPYMIHQFAQYLDKKLEQQRHSHLEVRVEAYSSLNHRPGQLLIDTTVDLSKQTYSDFHHNDWILQLDEALKPETALEEKQRKEREKKERRERREDAKDNDSDER